MTHEACMRLGLRLARRALGCTSPNPIVGAVLVKAGRIIGRGWHHRAGKPHAEIEALRDAARRGNDPRGAVLYVTLEPCCTEGLTPPCTDALVRAGVRAVIAGATDPNPRHCGRGFAVLRRAGIEVVTGVLAGECERLNEAFNHWIVHRTPFVTVKSAMTLDGKIATVSGQSKWITGGPARAYGMRLRQASDAILVGVNTILEDDPSLTFREGQTRASVNNALFSSKKTHASLDGSNQADSGQAKLLRRIILDSVARTPLEARIASDKDRALTTIVVGEAAPEARLNQLRERVDVLVAPCRDDKIDLSWLLQRLGGQNVTGLLVEGGGEVNASFLLGGFAHRIAFFYAPRILGGSDSRKAVAGPGATLPLEQLVLRDVTWRKLRNDWLLSARCASLTKLPAKSLSCSRLTTPASLSHDRQLASQK